MLNLDAIPSNIVHEVKEYLCLNDLPCARHHIAALSPETFFECYCQYNGLINHAKTLITVLDAARKAVRP